MSLYRLNRRTPVLQAMNYCSTRAVSKWVTIYTGTKATDTSYTVKNLTAGTAGYRFRIRAYKIYGSTKQYGSWSKELTVVTKK